MSPTTGASKRCQVSPLTTNPPAVAATCGVTLATPDGGAGVAGLLDGEIGLQGDGRQKAGDGAVLGDQGLQIIFALKADVLVVFIGQRHGAGEGKRLARLVGHGPWQAGINDLAVGHDFLPLVDAGEKSKLRAK